MDWLRKTVTAKKLRNTATLTFAAMAGFDMAQGRLALAALDMLLAGMFLNWKRRP